MDFQEFRPNRTRGSNLNCHLRISSSEARKKHGKQITNTIYFTKSYRRAHGEPRTLNIGIDKDTGKMICALNAPKEMLRNGCYRISNGTFSNQRLVNFILQHFDANYRKGPKCKVDLNLKPYKTTNGIEWKELVVAGSDPGLNYEAI